MHRHKDFQNLLIIILRTTFIVLSSCVLTNPPIRLAEAGASSTPKNLVNLSSPNESEGANIVGNGGVNNGSNLTTTGSNLFQNEYQFNRQSSLKSNLPERLRTSSLTNLNDAASTVSTSSDQTANVPFGNQNTDYSDMRVMTNVPDCEGRLKLNGSRGYITDGPGYYQTNLQCIWLIDSGLKNATIRLQIHQFNTECNYDFLYVFDGDSVYSPLVAALSGDMKDFSNALREARLEDQISTATDFSETNTSVSTFLPTTTSNLTTQNNATNGANINNDASDGNNTTTSEIISTESKGPLQQQDSVQQSHQLVELKTYSGKAFIYFHSDTAQTMPGFYLTYSIDSCPLDCSNRGDCDYKTLTCRCNNGYFGDGCRHVLCPNNCTSPIHGTCDKEKSCLCNHDFTGPDCSRRTDQQHWNLLLLDEANTIPARAFHQAVIIDQTMWIFGGKSQALSNTNTGIFKHTKTPMILSYDLVQGRWNNLKGKQQNDVEDSIYIGETGQDHLAELSGHSVAISGNKAFIYGGMAMNNSVLDTLTVFDSRAKSLNVISNGVKKSTSSGLSEVDFVAPIAVVGHSANIIDGFMYVFMGYNPLFGYLNFAQKFNIANNTWSIVQRRGSSVSGCISHTSTFDPVTRLIYIYGGHNLYRSSRLYSFNPQAEVWTYLHSGPAPRYYHSAIIMNGLLTILGGNSYNISHQSDQCYQQTDLVYDLSCAVQSSTDKLSIQNQTSPSIIGTCGHKCWSQLSDDGLGTLKRHGHSIVVDDEREQLVLYGGFNGILLSDLRSLKIRSCSNFTSELECMKPKLGLSCVWNTINLACEVKDRTSFGQINHTDSGLGESRECSKSDTRKLQLICEARETCADCLSTSLGCVWCGLFSQCQYSKCRMPGGKAIVKLEQCYRDDVLLDPIAAYIKSTSSNSSTKLGGLISNGEQQDHEIDCKVDNCYLCQSRPYCSWQNDACIFSPPPPQTNVPLVHTGSSPSVYSSGDLYGSMTTSLPDESMEQPPPPLPTPSMLTSGARSRTTSDLMLGGSPWIVTPIEQWTKRNRSSSLSSTGDPNSIGHVYPSPYQACDMPCILRRSCDQCTTTKCIWCSTTEQCIDSTAYFAYHAMGQCMHYVAHSLKCPVASCSDIYTCDKCLANPKCGWLNDISNTGKGTCIEGTSSGPSIQSASSEEQRSNATTFNFAHLGASKYTSQSGSSILLSMSSSVPPTNWFYTSCPGCQCNGHSFCKQNSSSCVTPCQDFTEGVHCERCVAGYYGDPVNGGSCLPCKCNGHAQTCNRETGKCYCSTKGIVGHDCNRCDDKNWYIGDPSSPSNGTCYYNLTTDYQYTFNMSKPEDHFYSDINFINVPTRKDSDAEFSIACSRLALVNITSGTSYKNRRLIQAGLECGSFRLRFPHDRHTFNDANYSFFVHVYKFQTPFILQISFSQHRTIYLPQFFFTFSSCFLFFFALSGIFYKLKHEYDLYMQRHRQFIEMEQMASRPFSTILLEMFRPTLATQKESISDISGKQFEGGLVKQQEPTAAQASACIEPTPISFEPCFGSNVGVLSVFVQLPGRPNLAIGSTLVSLNDESMTVSSISSTTSSETASACGIDATNISDTPNDHKVR